LSGLRVSRRERGGDGMKLSHEDYLKQQLKMKKSELEFVKEQHKINVAIYETKADMLEKEIYSLEQQLASK